MSPSLSVPGWVRKLALVIVAVTAMPVTPRAAPADNRFPEGIWQSHGYGELIVVAGDNYQIFDITSETCLERQSGSFSDDSDLYLYPSIEHPKPDRMVVQGNFYRYEFEQLQQLPEPCTRLTDPSDPRFNFDVFWHSFSENYVSFESKGIDWNEIRRTYRTRITSDMKEADLYGLLGEIVELIDDPHVFLSNRKPGDENLSWGSPVPHGLARALSESFPGQEKSDYDRAANELEPALEQLIRYEVLGGQFSTAFTDRFTWGWIDEDIGYLRMSQYRGLFSHLGTDTAAMQMELDDQLDKIFSTFAGAKGLILDVTTNVGGATFIPDAVARRIIQQPKAVLTKKGRAPEGFTEPVTQTLHPVDRPGYDGPVAILISENTVSAGEHLLFALADLSNVTTIGEPTLGAHSDIMMKPLPYGGIFGISNEVVLTAEGEWFEGRGFAPDVPFAPFDPERPISGYHGLIEVAVRVLEAATNTK